MRIASFTTSAAALIAAFVSVVSARVVLSPVDSSVAAFSGRVSAGENGSSSIQHDLVERKILAASVLPISDERWQYMVSKGCNLLMAMGATDKDAAVWVGREGSAESSFQKFPDDLQKWGYNEQDAKVAFRRGAPAYKEAFEALGLDPAKELGERGHGPNVAVAYLHEEDKVIDGVEYRHTDANFKTIVNVKDGVILAWFKYGPAYNGRGQMPPVTVLPKLKNWSDIAFLSWRRQGGKGNLKYIWSAPCANTELPGILGRALSEAEKRKDTKMPRNAPFDEDKECSSYAWKDRVELQMDTAPAKALLGSPNGRGAGHLLLEHKSTFGKLTTIGQVTFYCSGANLDEINLIFHVHSQAGKKNTENW